MDRLKVAIIFGGCSEEHPISVKSAQEVAKHLDIEKYDRSISDTKSGAWKLCDGPGANWENNNCRPAMLSPDRSVHGCLFWNRDNTKRSVWIWCFPFCTANRRGWCDAGFVGAFGIPYVGCDIQSSALCMDKSLAYIVVRNAGIATPNFWIVTADEDIDADRLPYPVVVKPARSGSSFGVSKVSRKEELLSAVEPQDSMTRRC